MDHALMMGMNNAKPLHAHAGMGGGQQSLQQKLLSTAAQQPYQMRTSTASFANQYVNQAVSQATTQSYPLQAQPQQYAPTQQIPPHSYQMPAVQNQQYSYPQAMPPLMQAPNGMGPALQQFGSASSGDNQVPRLRTMVSR
jgi:hypothetical protein